MWKICLHCNMAILRYYRFYKYYIHTWIIKTPNSTLTIYIPKLSLLLKIRLFLRIFLKKKIIFSIYNY